MDGAGEIYLLEINPNCGVLYPPGLHGSAGACGAVGALWSVHVPHTRCGMGGKRRLTSAPRQTCSPPCNLLTLPPPPCCPADYILSLDPEHDHAHFLATIFATAISRHSMRQPKVGCEVQVLRAACCRCFRTGLAFVLYLL